MDIKIITTEKEIDLDIIRQQITELENEAEAILPVLIPDEAEVQIIELLPTGITSQLRELIERENNERDLIKADILEQKKSKEAELNFYLEQ